ncbi:MAG: glycoside hydrolase family 65 protein [Thermodesulfobacteriota bacterium]|nr:glycoside hydrolase family 65 protein [Thermodesulfobacteriota bacterium]
MTAWNLTYETYTPEDQGLREALCTLGNGYFATRGASAQVSAGDIHYPGTYLAGGYNRLTTVIAGKEVENEDLVNMPNWLCLKFRFSDGQWFSPDTAAIRSYCQDLDMKKGILTHIVVFEDEQERRIRMEEQRIVHMGDRHTAAMQVSLTSENHTGSLEVESAIDGTVQNQGVKRYRELNSHHLDILESESKKDQPLFLKVQTVQSELRVAMAARTRILKKSKVLDLEPQLINDNGYVAKRFTVDITQKETIVVEKTVLVHTSRDIAISECGLSARARIGRASGFDDMLTCHTLAWKQLWRRSDIKMTDRRKKRPDLHPEMVVRLYTFHLLQTVSKQSINLDVGVPARGWHGEAYRGHIFWDELYIYPFITLQYPEINRSLLLYRYRRLDAARAAAKKAGFKGAMFPWQSGSSGREETQTMHLNPKSGRWLPDNSHFQRHVNAAIAFNIWKYFESTGDVQFMGEYGAEGLLEIARFWASIATFNKDLDRYEILKVMGPDEYHDAYPDADEPGLDNNAYTNVMATWVLTQAQNVLEILPRDRVDELCETLGITKSETDLWWEISRKMRIIFHDDNIISQFEHYDQLKELDWERYRKKYTNIQRMDRILEAEGDSANNYKITKQADVLMLFYLFSAPELRTLFRQLGYPFEYETIPKNIEYYVRRTSYGSSLSWVVHSWVMARSDRKRSWKFFLKALQSDIENIQGGTTQEGIHLGAMAGSVNILQEAYMGIKTRNNILWINPELPEVLEKLEMQVRHRGSTLAFETTQEMCKITLLCSPKNTFRFGFKDNLYELTVGATRKFHV